jgi:hypothetical protein
MLSAIKMFLVPPRLCLNRGVVLVTGDESVASIAARRVFTAFCTFSKARVSIWRTRSRET